MNFEVAEVLRVKLNGWRRLWIVLSVVWLLAVLVISYDGYPQEVLHRDVTDDMTTQHWEGQYTCPPDGTTLQLPRLNNTRQPHVLCFAASVPKEQVLSIGQEYYDALGRADRNASVELKKNRITWSAVMIGLGSVPSLCVYVLGAAFAWVLRGFRSQG